MIKTLCTLLLVTTTLAADPAGDNRVLTFCTAYPLKGDLTIIGRKMQAGMENYLRAFHHFVENNSRSPQQNNVVFHHIYNASDPGDDGMNELKTTLAKHPLLVGSAGHETFLSLTPLIEKKKIALLFPLEGTSKIRKKNYPNVVYFRPSYEQELRALADYAIKTKFKNHVAIFFEASYWGEDLKSTLEKILKEYEVASITSSSYPQGTVDIEHSLNVIANRFPDAMDGVAHTSPNVVFCLAQPRPALNFVSQAVNVGLHECLFLGLSHLSVIQKLLHVHKGLDVAVTSVVPDAEHSNIELVRRYKEALSSFFTTHDDSPLYLEAFINYALLEQSLKEITGPITPESILASVKAQTNLWGLPLKLNPATNTLSSALWINPGLGKPWVNVGEVS